MLNNASLTVKQAEFVKAMRAHFKGKNVVTRNEMVAYMQTLTPPQKYAPEFIVKNEAFKAKDKEGNVLRGQYRLPAAVASPESRAKEKAKVAAAKTKASTKKTKKTGEETTTVKRVSKPKTQGAKDRKAALEAAAEVIENEPTTETETAMAVGAEPETE